MNELFASVLVDEPPLRLTVGGVCASGRRRSRQRQVVMAAGLSVLVVGATATVVAAAPGVRGLPGPVGPGLSTPPAWDTRDCPADPDLQPLNVDDKDGSVLPDPDAAARAVLAVATAIAPAREFSLALAELIEAGPKNPGSPRVVLVFHVSTGAGVGAIHMELIPQVGAVPAARADHAVAARPYDDCGPPRRTNFPDGTVALHYTTFSYVDGQAWPYRHTHYYANDGLDINASVFMNEPIGPDDRPALTDLPLTDAEATDLARVVADSR